MGVATDADDNTTIELPIRSARGERIHKAGSITAQNAAFAEAIDDTMATLYATDTHYLCRAADLHSGNFTDLQIALMAQGKLRKTPLLSLDEAAINKSSWTTAYLIPVPLASETTIDADNDERIAEQVLGEEVVLLTKIKAVNKINRSMDSLGTVLCFLGNCYCLPQISFNVGSVKPIFSLCVEEVAHCLTDPNTRRWFERACLREGGHHLPWAVFNIIEQVSPLVFDIFLYLVPHTTPHRITTPQVAIQLSNIVKESHINALERGDLKLIAPALYRDCITTVRTFTHRMGAAAKGGERIVETALYLTSAKKRQLDQIKCMREKARLREVAGLITVPSRPSKDKGRATQGDAKADSNKRIKTGNAASKVGDIKCYDSANPTNRIRLMPLPHLTTGPQPCAPFYRDGSMCKHGDDCKFAHCPMVDLPEQSRKEWFDHVHKTPTLHFNMKTCTCFMDAAGNLKPPS